MSEYPRPAKIDFTAEDRDAIHSALFLICERYLGPVDVEEVLYEPDGRKASQYVRIELGRIGIDACEVFKEFGVIEKLGKTE